MWIDYVIGAGAFAIVALVFGRFSQKIIKKQHSDFVCGGHCAHCKYNLKDKCDKE